MNDDQTTDHDYSAFDEKHREWLIRPELELFAILSLGHGIDPRRRGEALWEFRPRYNSLKAAGSKGLKIDHSLRPELDWGAVVFLEDLLMFLRTAGPEYDWLRNFAKRWQSYAGPRGQELQPHEDVQVVAVRSRPSHRPPTLREEVLKVLRTSARISYRRKWTVCLSMLTISCQMVSAHQKIHCAALWNH